MAAIYIEHFTDTAVTGKRHQGPYDALYAGQGAFGAVGRQNSAEQANAAYQRAHAANHADGTVHLARPDTAAARWPSCLTAALSRGALTNLSLKVGRRCRFRLVQDQASP